MDNDIENLDYRKLSPTTQRKMNAGKGQIKDPETYKKFMDECDERARERERP